jgi:hypothetical protein
MKLLIDFKLKNVDDIAPWGSGQNENMHWFGLTDSNYWLNLGESKLYEYSQLFLQRHNIEGMNYVDYNLIRFIEDFTQLFEIITESIPDDFYTIVKDHESLSTFYQSSKKWLDEIGEDDSVDVDTYYDRYDLLIEWLYSRHLTSIHLIGGPSVGFYRYKDRIKIIWDANDKTEEGFDIWTAKSGNMEISYSDFISEIKDFGNRFFTAMDKQVEVAINKDWGTVRIDKQRLVEENNERKIEFYNQVELLTEPKQKETDWILIRTLIDEMNNI